jgi:hypothetical protein
MGRRDSAHGRVGESGRSTSRHSSIASRSRSINLSRDRACVWQNKAGATAPLAQQGPMRAPPGRAAHHLECGAASRNSFRNSTSRALNSPVCALIMT